MTLIIDQTNKSKIFDSVVFLYDSNESPRGSGFLIKYQKKVYLITVAHNLIKAYNEQKISDNTKEPEIKVCVYFNDSKVNMLSIPIKCLEFDRDNDLAVIDFTPFVKGAGIQTTAGGVIDMGFSRDVFFCKEMLCSEDDKEYLKEGVETLSIGLFHYYYGNKKEQPICRFGHIAMIPYDQISIPLPTMENQREEKQVKAYLIEHKSVGGMSGSVVFATPNGNKKEAKIIGILHGHYNESLYGDCYKWNNKVHYDYDEILTEEKKCQNVRTECDNLYAKCQEVLKIVQNKCEAIREINNGISIVIPAYKILKLLSKIEDQSKKMTE